ncbi:MAG: XRE family transcriptional regulator [Dehalococcoidia bacterium]|nr:MAG: XRE family transcriptional regulator [Dehalococcoidia bacterium]
MTDQQAATDKEHLSGWLDHYSSKLAHDPNYVAERLAIRFADRVAQIMDEEGTSRSELAEAMGVSRAYVTKIMTAPPNLTLRSLAAVALALEAQVEITVSRESDLSHAVRSFVGSHHLDAADADGAFKLLMFHRAQALTADEPKPLAATVAGSTPVPTLLATAAG